jgi:hypothetical protein
MKTIASRFLFSLFLQIVFVTVTFSQSRELLIKSGYIEKFTHFVQWPEGEKVGSAEKFTIAVIGNDKISNTLKEIFSKSGPESANVSIVEIKTPEEMGKCQLLFISGSEKNNLKKILSYTNGKPVLTISDTKGFCEKGVIINLFMEGDYIRYELNRNSLDKSGLKINSLLLGHAVII